MTKIRILIIGFMGSGKTTVAEALARKLNCAMIDLDSFITQREGRSPAEIIVEDGEPAFREIETQAMREVLEKDVAGVIALGGGTWTIESNRALVAQHDCVSFWLDTPFEVCWERITASGTARPLAGNREDARLLYQSRRDAYQIGSRRIPVNGSDNAKTIAEVLLKQT